MGIGFLKSYEHMGQVRVTCEHECECEGLLIDAHTRERISPLDLQYFSARVKPMVGLGAGTAVGAAAEAAALLGVVPPKRRCGLQLTVLNTTSSGEHKFKLTALFLNQHGDDSYFGRWIFSQAAEARGAVEVAEVAEVRSRHKAAGMMKRRMGRGRAGRPRHKA